MTNSFWHTEALIPLAFEKQRIPFYLTFAAAVAPLFSGAVCNILIALAVVSLLIFRVRPKMPPVLLPLGLFFAGTVIATLASPDPWAGRTGVRKFYLFLLMMLVYTTFEKLSEAVALLYSWALLMTASAVWSLVQFAQKYREAQALKQSFYQYYTGERITGFQSHWMTLGGQEMNVILLIAALWFFGRQNGDRFRPYLLPAAAIILASLIAGFTRSIWLGTAVAGLYLIWCWKRWAVLAAPAPLLLLIAANPADLRERVISAFQPHGDRDSNEFRVVCRRTGAEMIRSHPWLGLGPEQVRVQFQQWIPKEIPRPLPTGWYGHLHNVYLQHAAERGVPTMLMFLWWIARMFWDFALALRRRHGDAAMLRGAIAVIVGVLLTGFYEFNLGDAEVLSLFLITMSCGYLAMRTEAQPDFR